MSNFNINFTWRKTKEGQYQAVLTITGNYQRATKHLRFFCVKNPEASKKRKYLPNELEIIKLDVLKIIQKMEQNGLELTPKSILECYENGINPTTHKLSQVCEEYLEILRKRVTERTVNRHINYVKLLITLVGDMEMEKYNRGHIEQFKNHITSIYKPATSICVWKKTKAIFKYALDCGYMTTNPFSNITIKQERPEITYLDKESIDKLKAAVMPNESLQNIVDCALFQIASGLAYCDLKELEESDIKSINGTYYIKKERVKTGHNFVAFILPFGVDIWKKHNGKLPVISNQKYNSYLKVVGDILNINQRLHTHLFRHTYCTLLLNSGVPLEVVSKAAGHTNTLITQQYYAHLEDLTIINTIKNAVK